MLSRMLSVPQTASMLSAVPSALEECVHSVPDPRHLKTVLLHHTTLGHLDLSGESPLGYMHRIMSHAVRLPCPLCWVCPPVTEDHVICPHMSDEFRVCVL